MCNTSTPQWVNKRNAAETLGCSQKTVDRLIKAGRIRATKVGSAVRVDIDSVHAYLDANVIGGDAA